MLYITSCREEMMKRNKYPSETEKLLTRNVPRLALVEVNFNHKG